MQIGKSNVESRLKITFPDFTWTVKDVEIDDDAKSLFLDTLTPLHRRLIHFRRDVPPRNRLKNYFTVEQGFYEKASADLQDFILEVLDRYGIRTENWHLSSDPFYPPSIGTYLTLFGDTIRKVNLVETHYANTIDDLKFMVLHELRHVEQMNRGWLQHVRHGNEAITLWKGKVVGCTLQDCGNSIHDYNMLPQELDANIFAVQSGLFDIHSAHSYMSNIQVGMKHSHRWTEKDGID